MRAHWSRVPERGLTWSDFCAEVSALPPKQLWRHNEAGDLPGEDQRIDSGKLFLLVVANMGRRGFTFTHKPVLGRTSMLRHNRAAVTVANLHGFTVNLSADSLVEADKLAALGVAPVVVVVPSDAPRRLRTPAGRHVVLCPAETHELTCDECRLCASRTRKSIVGFRAHGQMRKHVSELVTLRRSATGKKASA